METDVVTEPAPSRQKSSLKVAIPDVENVDPRTPSPLKVDKRVSVILGSESRHEGDSADGRVQPHLQKWISSISARSPASVRARSSQGDLEESATNEMLSRKSSRQGTPDTKKISSAVEAAPRTLEQTALMKRPEERTEADLDILEELLLRVKFKVDLSPENRRQVAGALEFRSIRSGRRIFAQGDPGEEFFIILKGSVLVSIKHEGTENEKIIATLIAGDSFGDLALLQPGAVRRATCVCKEECHFAVLHKRHFDQYIHAENRAGLIEKLDFLRTLPVLGDQAEPLLTALAYVCTPREFPPSQIIVAQGDEIEDMYFIVSGSVKLIKELDKHAGLTRRSLHDFENPFRDDTKKANPKFRHVVSPTMQYIRQRGGRTLPPERRAEILASGRAKLVRAVAKLSAHRGLAQLALAAAQNKGKIIKPVMTLELARNFQHMTRVEVKDRLFLEIATAGPCEFFGEDCLEKESKSNVTVVSHTGIKVYILNKWDILKMLPKDVWTQLQECTVVGGMDEASLQEQFYRHLRWERYRTQLVDDVLLKRDEYRAVHSPFSWDTPCRLRRINKGLQQWR